MARRLVLAGFVGHIFRYLPPYTSGACYKLEEMVCIVKVKLLQENGSNFLSVKSFLRSTRAANTAPGVFSTCMVEKDD